MKELLKSRFPRKEEGITEHALSAKKFSDVNTSSILSKLIKEAGRCCKHYASDLFISWSSLTNKIEEVMTAQATDWEHTFYFGFRDMGVDHDVYIANRIESPEIYGYPYLAVYALEVSLKRTSTIYPEYEIKMDLHKVDGGKTNE